MSTAVEKPRVAIVGCGRMARNHVKALEAWRGFEFVAGVDPYREAFNNLPIERFAPRYYSSTTDMLAAEDPDLVVVATTAEHHLSPTIESLRAGAHVLVEKPMAWSPGDADLMLKVAGESRGQLLVNHEYSVNPRTAGALDAIRNGLIGRITAMHGSFKGTFSGGWDLAEGGPHLFALASLVAGEPTSIAATVTTSGRRAVPGDVGASLDAAARSTGPTVGDQICARVGFSSGVELRAEFLGHSTKPALIVEGTDGAVYLPYASISDPAMSTSDLYDPMAEWTILPSAPELDLPNLDGLNPRAVAEGYASIDEWLRGGAAEPHPLSATYGSRALEVIHGVYFSHFRAAGREVSLPIPERRHGLESLEGDVTA